MREKSQNTIHSKGVCINTLTPDELRRFSELSVFPFDTAVPAKTIVTLWSHTGPMDSLEAADLLVSLAKRSFISLKRPNPGSDSCRRPEGRLAAASITVFWITISYWIFSYR